MKKKWKLLLGMLIFTMLVTNCKKEEPDGSIEKNKFIQEVIAFTKNEVLIKTPIKVHELEINENTVDFKNLTVIENKYAIAEFKDAGLTSSPDEYLIVLYYLEKKKITAANVIKFKSNRTPTFIKANLSEILSFEYPEYTGSINITSLHGKFLAAVKLEKGKTIATTSLGHETQTDPANSEANLKTVVCIAWYLVVTTYYSDGSTTVTRTFLGTTCSEGGGGSNNNGDPGVPDEAGKPCFGDPVLNPTIAPTQSGSLYGGMYGCTRVTTEPTKINCNVPPYNRYHNGIDIEAPIGSDLYSMHSGTIYDTGYSGDLGLYVRVKSIIGGNEVLIQYGHLSQIIISQPGTQVTAGQTIIAKSGNSGYENTPGTTPHVHIRVHVNWIESDPISFFGTEINSDGTITTLCTN